jgi:hypothetical protein
MRVTLAVYSPKLDWTLPKRLIQFRRDGMSLFLFYSTKKNEGPFFCYRTN